MTTKIEWTDETWNPTTGCTKVSAGCAHCYIERTPPFRIGHRSFEGGVGENHIGATTGVQVHPDRLDKPLHWRKPRRVFVNSLSDLFHDAVPDEFIAQVFAVMALTPQHTYQVLTKRPARMASLLANHDFNDAILVEACGPLGRDVRPWPEEPPPLPLPNVWLGVSVEDQATADLRIPKLLETPAAVRFLSCEPLLGPMAIARWLGCGDPDHRHSGPCSVYGAEGRIGWVIAGGESGPGARPPHPDWARSLRDQCVAAGVPFFWKQWGEWAPARHPNGVVAMLHPRVIDTREPDDRVAWMLTADLESMYKMERVGKKRAGRLLDGRTWDEFPEVRA